MIVVVATSVWWKCSVSMVFIFSYSLLLNAFIKSVAISTLWVAKCIFAPGSWGMRCDSVIIVVVLALDVNV